MIDSQRAALRYQNKVNNAQGHFFESAIKAACTLYSDRERADVDKTPEPFRVLEKSRDGKFKGRFTARAQPDFQGTLDGGVRLPQSAAGLETNSSLFRGRCGGT